MPPAATNVTGNAVHTSPHEFGETEAIRSTDFRSDGHLALANAHSKGGVLFEEPLLSRLESAPESEDLRSGHSSAESPEKLDRDSDDLLKDIAEYKGAGLTPVPSRFILCGLDALKLEEDLYRIEGVSLLIAKYAQSAVQEQFGQDKEAPEGLRDGNLEIRIPGLCLESRVISSTQGIVRLYDPLSKKFIIEKEVSISSGKIPAEERAALLTELKEAIAQTFENDCEKHRTILRSIEPDETIRNRMTYLPSEENADPASIASLRAALEGAECRIRCVGNGKETDFAPTLTLNAERLQFLGGKGLRINGQIQEIAFSSKEFPVHDYDPERQLVDGQPIFSAHFDTQGNLVKEKYLVFHAGSKLSAIRTITILPPLPFSADKDSPHGVQPVDLDLRFLGAGVAVGFLSHTELNPLASKGSYHFASNVNSQAMLRDFGEMLPCIAEGAEAAERYFGLNPGDKLKHIYIANSKDENALFQAVNPTTIIVQDELLKLDQPPEYTGFHETVHLLDAASKGTLSGEEFKKLFDALQNKGANPFFDRLNESNFMPGMKLGGHAQQNEFEFLASFCNSLRHPRWGPKMQSESPEFRDDYKKALEALLQNVEHCGMIPSGAPIISDLERKIEFLDTIAQRRFSFPIHAREK